MNKEPSKRSFKEGGEREKGISNIFGNFVDGFGWFLGIGGFS